MILYKAIKSAVSSARQLLKVEDNSLKFKLLTIEQGQKLKRFRPGSRGTVKPIVKSMSHIRITLEVKSAIKKEIKIEKKEETTIKKTKDQNSNVKSNPKSKTIKNKKN